MEALDSLRARLPESPLVANTLAAAGLAVAAVVACWVLRLLLRGCGCSMGQWTGSHRFGEVTQEATRRVEWWLLRLTLGGVVLVALASIAYHAAGRDVRADVRAWLGGLTRADLLGAGLWLAGLTLPLAAAWVAAHAVRRARPRLEGLAAARLDRSGNATDLQRWFGLLEGFAVAIGGVAAAWAAVHLLALPPSASWAVGLAARFILLLASVRMLPPAAGVLAATALDLGDRHLASGHPGRYWERLRQLAPFGLRCFAAAVYVCAASRALRELGPLAAVADYGTKVVICIGIFFACRVTIAVALVLLQETFELSAAGSADDQKGQTLVPLLQSLCQYLLYCGAGVMILGVLGVNTGPILAGAGLLGLAVGLGAQSLITDVVSGFFILFENQYLVGDQVRLGEEATGRVEAVSIRHTQVRDGRGRLHIIPNGQIKGVVNSSKGYVNAVVDLKLPAEEDLEEVLDAMREAGRHLRQEHAHGVLADTEVQGLVDLGLTEMTVRAVTRVLPGTHEALQAEYRRLLRRVLHERQLLGRARRAA